MDVDGSVESRTRFDELIFAPWDDGTDPDAADRAAAEAEMRRFRQAAGHLS